MEAPRPALQEKLSALNQTQQSIEGTSKWLLFYSTDAATIVKFWCEELGRCPPERKLALLYLANHVLQEGRKKGKAWVDEFAKVIVKAVRDFAQRADDKSKKSVERLIKVWEERRVFSPSQTKHLKDAIRISAAKPAAPVLSAGTPAAGANAAAAKAQPPSAMASSDLKKLQGCGKLPDMLLEVTKAEQTVSFVINRTRQIKASVSTDGAFAEVASARDVYTNCVKMLQAEVTARRKALSELRIMLTRQEGGLSRAEDQVRSFELLQRGVEDRFRMLQQQQQQQQQQKQAAESALTAAATAAAAAAAAAPAPPPQLPSYATPLPAHLAPHASPPGHMPMHPPPHPMWPHGRDAMQMPGMVPMMMAGSVTPGFGGMGMMPPPGMGMPPSMGPTPMPMMMPPPRPPPATASPSGQQHQQHQQHEQQHEQQLQHQAPNGSGGHARDADQSPAEASPQAAAAAPSSTGLDFTMTEEMAAQLAAHLSNQDTLLTLAKSLAEFMPQDGLLNLGPSSSDQQPTQHQHQQNSSPMAGLMQSQAGGGFSISGVYGQYGLGVEADSGTFQSSGAAGGDEGASPEAPGMDEYDPDDPV